MVEATLFVEMAFAVVSGVLFAYVGQHVASRQVAAEAKRALLLFAVWWFALAATNFIGVLQNGLAALGLTGLALHTTITYTSLLVICVALWGLLYYLIYLLTGSRRALAPLTAAYVAYYAFLVYLVTSAQPIGVTVGEWGVSLEYVNELAGSPLATAALVLLVAPQIIGALVYFTTFFRIDDPAKRYRVAIVSWSIIVWFGSSLVARAGGFEEALWWQYASRVLSLLAATAILLAYRPPRWVRGRWSDGDAMADAG